MRFCVRTVFTEAGLLPATFVESSDVRVGNFRFLHDRSLILIPGGPGYRKWKRLAEVHESEIEYHAKKTLAEIKRGKP